MAMEFLTVKKKEGVLLQEIRTVMAFLIIEI
jgi:hypothetical protein